MRSSRGRSPFLDRSDVDTDQIIPKQFLKRIERTGFGEFLFYDWIRDGEIELEPNPVLVSGPNFGSGSSREHAVWALADYGFQAVIAPSFSDIFYSNSTKNGFLPVVLPREHCRGIAEAGAVRIDLDDQTVDYAGGVIRFEIEEEIKHRLLGGHDEISITLQNVAAIDEYESGHPAVGRADDLALRMERAPRRGTGTPAPTTGSPSRSRTGPAPSSTGSACAATRPCWTPAAAAARVTQLLLDRLPEGG